MAFRRESLNKIGGLESIANYLADDYELGHRIANIGLRVELAECIVDHYLPPCSLQDFFQHQLRWARTIRGSRPRGYAGLIFTCTLPWSFLAVVAWSGALWTWILLAAAFALRVSVALLCGIAVLRERHPFRELPLLPIRDLITPFIWLASYAGREVVWRGARFKVVKGKLRPA